DALTLMQSGDFAAAAKALESVTAREPQNGRAWRNLALAYERLHQPDRAIDAFQHSLSAQPDFPAPLFQLARLYAGKSDPDFAIESLTKPQATHKLDPTQIETRPKSATLPNAPRVK